MKYLIVLLLSVNVLFAGPRKELTKYVLKHKLNKNYIEGVGYKILFDRMDRANKSQFEIASYLNENESSYLFVSDSLYSNSSSPENIVKFDYVNYSIIDIALIDTLKAKLAKWEERQFTTETMPVIIKKEYALNADLTLLLEFSNKLDIYYETTKSDPEFEKGTNVYVAQLLQVVVVFKGRKHHMTYREFRRTFDISKDF